MRSTTVLGIGILLVMASCANGAPKGSKRGLYEYPGNGSLNDGGGAGDGADAATDGGSDDDSMQGAGAGGAGGGEGGAGGDAGEGDVPVGGNGGGAGSAGSAGIMCDDNGPEPNDSEVLASPACGMPTCEMNDCDDHGSKGFGGDLEPAHGVVGPNDIDHVDFAGMDKLTGCDVNAVAETKSSGFRMCLFIACHEGATEILACESGTPATSANGDPGCCITAPGKIEIQHDCTEAANDNDSANMLIRIDDAPACTTYDIDYHF